MSTLTTSILLILHKSQLFVYFPHMIFFPSKKATEVYYVASNHRLDNRTTRLKPPHSFTRDPSNYGSSGFRQYLPVPIPRKSLRPGQRLKYPLFGRQVSLLGRRDLKESQNRKSVKDKSFYRYIVRLYGPTSSVSISSFDGLKVVPLGSRDLCVCRRRRVGKEDWSIHVSLRRLIGGPLPSSHQKREDVGSYGCLEREKGRWFPVSQSLKGHVKGLTK